jgi:hypothetical protein
MGHIVDVRSETCATDDDARALAERLLKTADWSIEAIEAWDGARYVCRVDRRDLPP